MNQKKSSKGCFNGCINIITAALLIFAGIAILTVILLIMSPPFRERLNQVNADVRHQIAQSLATPTPLPTLASAAAVPTTVRPTATPLQATWTPQPTPATATIRPTITPKPTKTPTPIPTFPTQTNTPTQTPTPSDTPTITPPGPSPTPSATRSQYPFTKSNISPFYLKAHEHGCNWVGIGGEVLDLNRNPVPPGSYQVHIWGHGVDSRIPAGSNSNYSPSGWEQHLFDTLVIRDYNVQLESANGTAVSLAYRIQTRSSCEQNLVRIDFVQNH
ncbi:MAG: hypothetical protein CSA11_09385 [Chloroflexi bacterium]|nr:MAG: hypothetical protein CSA11_09385 [Chloroflexota bacterium]